MLGFSISYIRDLIQDLMLDENKNSKVKGLGGFSENDPLRELTMRESIYGLAFFVNLKHDQIASDQYEIPEESLPSALTIFEVNLTAFLCVFCQTFTSILLLQDFLSINESSEEAKSDETPTLEKNSIIIVKFICAVLFHFKFETEIRNGLKMMKYVVLHPEQFRNPITAFCIGTSSASVIVLVEVINLWNLSNITEGTYSLMFDFIALGIIAEFDDYFIEVYRYSSLSAMIGKTMKFTNVTTPKRDVQSA